MSTVVGQSTGQEARTCADIIIITYQLHYFDYESTTVHYYCALLYEQHALVLLDLPLP